MFARTGDGHVKQPSFLFYVFCETVRVLLGIDVVDDHVRPFLALHTMHGRQHDTIVRPLRSEPPA